MMIKNYLKRIKLCLIFSTLENYERVKPVIAPERKHIW